MYSRFIKVAPNSGRGVMLMLGEALVISTALIWAVSYVLSAEALKKWILS